MRLRSDLTLVSYKARMKQHQQAINLVIKNLRKLVQGDKLAICCSGGADSMALLFCAQKIFDNLLVLHVQHDMRPIEQASADARLVATYCEANNLEFKLLHANLRNKGQNLGEQQYRQERYQQITQECRAQGYDCAATAHHADDQLETLIMKVCRGSGMRGLSGIAESVTKNKINFVRPLLHIDKTDVYEICAQKQLPYNEDATNTDNTYLRNKVRHQVVPLLREINSQVAKNANKIAKTSSDAQNLIEQQCRLLEQFEIDSTTIKLDALRLSNDAVIYEYIRLKMKLLCPHFEFDKLNQSQIEKIIGCIRKKGRSCLVLQDGISIQIDRNTCKFTKSK